MGEKYKPGPGDAQFFERPPIGELQTKQIERTTTTIPTAQEQKEREVARESLQAEISQERVAAQERLSKLREGLQNEKPVSGSFDQLSKTEIEELKRRAKVDRGIDLDDTFFEKLTSGGDAQMIDRKLLIFLTRQLQGMRSDGQEREIARVSAPTEPYPPMRGSEQREANIAAANARLAELRASVPTKPIKKSPPTFMQSLRDVPGAIGRLFKRGK